MAMINQLKSVHVYGSCSIHLVQGNGQEISTKDKLVSPPHASLTLHGNIDYNYSAALLVDPNRGSLATFDDFNLRRSRNILIFPYT